MEVAIAAVAAAGVAAPASLGQWVYAIILIVLGAGGQGLIKAYLDYKNNRKANEQVGIKTSAESQSLQVQGLEILVTNLQQDNAILRKDRDYWKDQYDVVRAQVEKVLAELDLYRGQVQELKEMLDKIQQHSPAAQAAMPPSERLKHKSFWDSDIETDYPYTERKENGEDDTE